MLRKDRASEFFIYFYVPSKTGISTFQEFFTELANIDEVHSRKTDSEKIEQAKENIEFFRKLGAFMSKVHVCLQEDRGPDGQVIFRRITRPDGMVDDDVPWQNFQIKPAKFDLEEHAEDPCSNGRKQ